MSKKIHGPLLVPALLLATNVFAANKGSLHLSTSENIAEKRLPAGDYTVKWENAEPNVQLRIMQAGRLVVSAPVKIVVLDNASTNDSTVISTNDKGSRRLQRIYFSGKKVALEIEGDLETLSVHDSN
ncbi:MAG TPA: hypothetical protein VHT28_07160 [Silvibacterium sp.]|nr:hypothetical protein [Silvibacterium sp.]